MWIADSPCCARLRSNAKLSSGKKPALRPIATEQPNGRWQTDCVNFTDTARKQNAGNITEPNTTIVTTVDHHNKRAWARAIIAPRAEQVGRALVPIVLQFGPPLIWQVSIVA